MSDIYTLVDDMKGYLLNPTNSTINVEDFSLDYKDFLTTRVTTEQAPRSNLGLSMLGVPCHRKIWYQINMTEKALPLDATTRYKFLYGDMIEMNILHLAKLAGHDVQNEQRQVEVGGVKGHIDCTIDGMLVDVKSAASYSYNKFESGALKTDDPFGYMSQLSSYLYASQSFVDYKDEAGFLAVDKEKGRFDLFVFNLQDYLDQKEEEVHGIVEMVKKPAPPRAYEDQAHQKSGNRCLKFQCQYCSFKKECWPGLRSFEYTGQGGRKYYVDMTVVKREPKVPEVKL